MSKRGIDLGEVAVTDTELQEEEELGRAVEASIRESLRGGSEQWAEEGGAERATEMGLKGTPSAETKEVMLTDGDASASKDACASPPLPAASSASSVSSAPYVEGMAAEPAPKLQSSKSFALSFENAVRRLLNERNEAMRKLRT